MAEGDPLVTRLRIAGSVLGVGAYNLILDYLEGLQLRYTSYRSAAADAGEQGWMDWFSSRMRVSFVRFAALSAAAILTQTVRFRPTPVGYSFVYLLNEFTPLGNGFLYGLASVWSGWQNSFVAGVLDAFVAQTATALGVGDAVSVLQTLSGVVAAVGLAGVVVPYLRRRGGLLAVAAVGLQTLVYFFAPNHYLMNAYYWLTVLAPATLNEDMSEWPSVLTESKLIRWLMNDISRASSAAAAGQSALFSASALPLVASAKDDDAGARAVVTQIAPSRALILEFVDAAERDTLGTLLHRRIAPSPDDGGGRSTADDGGLS